MEYIHVFISASNIKEERGLMGFGVPKEIATDYPSKEIETTINKYASDGWELVSFEPHWYYGKEAISMAMSVTRPLAIVGWYATFKRQK